MNQNENPSVNSGDPPVQTPPSNTTPVQYKLPAKQPTVTYIILAFTVLVFVGQFLSQQFLNFDLPAALGMKVNELIVAGQVWRLITPLFLHADPLHILFNMYALFVFGRRLERFYGHVRFLSLYFLAGLCGNLFSFYFQTNPSLGASTAIFGLVAAEGVFIYVNRKYFPNAARALREIVIIVIINLMLGLSAQIDNWGHLGGLVGGMAFAWFAGPLLDLKTTENGFQLLDRHNNSTTIFIVAGEAFILIILAAIRIFVIGA